MAWPMIAMMAASAVMKNKADEAAAEREQYNQQLTARFAPWTGLNSSGMDKTTPNLGADLSQAAVSGMMMNQNMQSADMDNQLAAAKIENLTGRRAAAEAKEPMTVDLESNKMDGGDQSQLPASRNNELTRDFSWDPKKRRPASEPTSPVRANPWLIIA